MLTGVLVLLVLVCMGAQSSVELRITVTRGPADIASTCVYMCRWGGGGEEGASEFLTKHNIMTYVRMYMWHCGDAIPDDVTEFG